MVNAGVKDKGVAVCDAGFDAGVKNRGEGKGVAVFDVGFDGRGEEQGVGRPADGKGQSGSGSELLAGAVGPLFYGRLCCLQRQLRCSGGVEGRGKGRERQGSGR